MYHDRADRGDRPDVSQAVRLTVGKDGRILVPAAMQQALDFAPGATVVARVRDGRLVLEEFHAGIRRVQALFAELDTGEGSMADQLIAERREEARREAEA